jgi:hypothetical protein
LHQSAELLGLNDEFFLHQDNARCHVSAYSRWFFEENEIKLFEWLAQSPDLNPIACLGIYDEGISEKKN